MIYNKKEIAIIEAAQRTHISWAFFLENNPKQSSEEQYKNIGNTKHHRKYIHDYALVLHKLKTTVPVSLVIWLLLIMFLFGVYCEYMILTH